METHDPTPNLEIVTLQPPGLTPMCKSHLYIMPVEMRTELKHGDSVLGSVPSVQNVAGSNPTLAATYGPWASPSQTIALQYYCICAAEAWNCTSKLPVRRAISKLSCIVYCIVYCPKFKWVDLKEFIAIKKQTVIV